MASFRTRMCLRKVLGQTWANGVGGDRHRDSCRRLPQRRSCGQPESGGSYSRKDLIQSQVSGLLSSHGSVVSSRVFSRAEERWSGADQPKTTFYVIPVGEVSRSGVYRVSRLGYGSGAVGRSDLRRSHRLLERR